MKTQKEPKKVVHCVNSKTVYLKPESVQTIQAIAKKENRSFSNAIAVSADYYFKSHIDNK